MEKEIYVKPEMEIVEFETEDVITTSGEPQIPGIDDQYIKSFGGRRYIPPLFSQFQSWRKKD